MSDTRRVVGDLTVDASNLYREESYTDLKVASLRRLDPDQADRRARPLARDALDRADPAHVAGGAGARVRR